MTKKPTAASTRPTTIERRGTPALRSCRPGTSNLTTWAPPMTTDTTASTDQAVAEPTANAQTAIAAQTSSAPGSTGTTTPTMPTAIATPTSRTPTSFTRHCSSRSLERLCREYASEASPGQGTATTAARVSAQSQLPT